MSLHARVYILRKRLCMPLPPFSRALVISTQNVLNLSKIALVYAVKNLTRTQISDFLGFGQHWPLLQIVDQNIRLHNIIYTLAITNQVNVLSPCTGGRGHSASIRFIILENTQNYIKKFCCFRYTFLWTDFYWRLIILDLLM